MKIIKQILAALMALTLVFCCCEPMTLKAANNTKANVSLCVGEKYTLSIGKTPKQLKSVKWTSSNKKVVSVGKSSKYKKIQVVLKANKAGSANVTAKVKVGKKIKTYKRKIVVKNHEFTSPKYKWSADYKKCSASMKCKSCKKQVKETVNTSSVITVPATGTTNGEMQYTAIFQNKRFKKQVSKVKIPVSTMAFAMNVCDMYIGGVKEITVDTSKDLSDKKIEWKSNNPQICSVMVTDKDETYKRATINAKSVGDAIITASYGPCSASFTVHCISDANILISQSNSYISINPGTAKTINATLTNATPADNVTWKSQNTNICTVTSSGTNNKTVKIIANVPGTTNVIGQLPNGRSVSITVVVNTTDPTITCSTKSITLNVGESKKVTTTLKNIVPSTENVIWTQTDPSVCSLIPSGDNNRNVSILAYKDGYTKVTGTISNGQSISFKVIVNE